MSSKKTLPGLIIMIAVVLAAVLSWTLGNYDPDKDPSYAPTEPPSVTADPQGSDVNSQNAPVENDSTAQSSPDATVSETQAGDLTQSETSQETTGSQATPGYSPNGIKLLPEPVIISWDESNWELTLLNTHYRMDGNYTPKLAPSISGSAEELEYRVAEAYQKMYDAGLRDGVEVTPCSGYRSYALQTKNYNNKIKKFEDEGYTHDEAAALAAQIIMPPGSSEHNYGLCMDIGWVDESFENGQAFPWLMEHAAEYGFILRYPADKTEITGVEYEPWHWRYVGVENAQKIKASGLCLEEYLGKTE